MKNRGYLLIETLIALLLAASLLSALVTLQLHLLRGSRLATEHAIAAVHAEATAESLFGSIRAGEAPGDGEDHTQAVAPDGSNAGFEYQRRWSVMTAAGLTQGEIVVAWPDEDSAPPQRIALSISAQPAAAIASGQASVAPLPP
jgi:Tfp pilus assembly protein PilV